MQEERLLEGSPQVNWVFEFVRHKQSYKKDFFHKQLVAKKIMLGRTEQNLKLGVFEHESDLAG